MKSKLFLLLFILISGSLLAQEPHLSKKEQRKFNKQQKEREKAIEEEQSALKIEEMISSRRFVIEATTVSGIDGKSTPVGGSSNYVFMDVTRAAAQTGIDGSAGDEGVNWFRFSGPVRNYEWSKDKHGTYLVKFEVMYEYGVYEVIMDVKSNGYAVADLSRAGFGYWKRLSGNVKDHSVSMVSSELIKWD